MKAEMSDEWFDHEYGKGWAHLTARYLIQHQMMLQIKLKFNWSQVNLSAILLNWSKKVN